MDPINGSYEVDSGPNIGEGKTAERNHRKLRLD